MKKLLLRAVITGVVLTGILNFATQGKAEFGAGDFKVAENAFFG
ncbi:Phr family secreted Rap phosphatase inhibitor [Bacillus paralicheniformis]